MDPITHVAIPVLTILAMAVVGLDLRAADIVRVAREPARLAVATASQILLLPVVAFAVIALLAPPPHRTLGLIVIAACPGGAFSNFFTALARGATALSVALTTTCTLVSVVTLPLITAAGFAVFESTAGVARPPVVSMIGQLIALVVLPLIAGMALRRWRPAFSAGARPRLLRVVLAGIVGVVVWIAVARAPVLKAEAIPGAVTAILFLVPAMVLGELLGRAARVTPAERFAFVVELGFRNLGLAVVVTVTVLRQPAFLAFATVFFVTAVLCALAAVGIFRRRSP